MRNTAREAARKVAPGVLAAVEDVARLRDEVQRLNRRVADMEEDVQENRRLNRRVAELTDLVQELLLPVAARDDEKVAELLEREADLF
jgi:uncharacterized protein involved in exopolysaccharide biosynthesis